MTRLDLVKSYSTVLSRRSLCATQGLAILLLAEEEHTGITRAQFLRASGLTEHGTRHILDGLVRQDICTRSPGPSSTKCPNPPYIYHLTTAGRQLARELLAHS